MVRSFESCWGSTVSSFTQPPRLRVSARENTYSPIDVRGLSPKDFCFTRSRRDAEFFVAAFGGACPHFTRLVPGCELRVPGLSSLGLHRRLVPRPVARLVCVGVFHGLLSILKTL